MSTLTATAWKPSCAICRKAFASLGFLNDPACCCIGCYQLAFDTARANGLTYDIYGERVPTDLLLHSSGITQDMTEDVAGILRAMIAESRKGNTP